ncbi:hypothetical protein ACTI_40810 [Actinoplanes sp. OR16]|uniref:FxsB family cyclophane-forming radical SAM/SPASM peptide maturase n=1 Tax=Actinoplanes sp. OR16 TaxID=946334 RepID=UPI000F71A4DF|nr:FxsB family cyclophane-forming radical SAM/SPASM peptide maturase [Actinoplanes sp. OR16]BBH67396.1 hypothetical protein ACTI_40810 [Actinoplanes sp. OR16]
MHPRWPYQLLDLDRLRAGGWRPRPFREFVLKVHQRCNLACTYCYVYESPDQSWRQRPRLMSDDVWQAASRRIAEHAGEHSLDEVRVVLHGGEPLLAGPARLRSKIAELRTALPATTTAQVTMQTNGIGLTPKALAELAAADIRVGVSIDGTATDHDRHRVFRNGRGSHAATARALQNLHDHPHLYAGLLCTIDPTTDPVATYRALLSHEPPAVDLLLPHANWAQPPQHDTARWLIAVFDQWYAEPKTRIRLFEDVMSLLLGGSSRSEQIGLSPVVVAVVESDGAIEQVDALKSTYPGAAATGRNVLTDAFDTVLTHPGVAARQIGVEALADGCRSCPVHRVCGAGHYAHRYRPGDGFRNPTVYCADMNRLIRHISERLKADLRQ